MARKPTDVLDEEHRVIHKVVAAMAPLVEALEGKQQVEPQVLRDIVEFMRTFADRWHHGKEEDHLFPALQEKGVPAGGCPLGALKQDHVEGRALVKALAEATEAYAGGDASSRDALVGALKDLLDLYPGHIWKEDYLLFPMTEKIVDPSGQKELMAQFDEVEEKIGRETLDRSLGIADRLAGNVQAS